MKNRWIYTVITGLMACMTAMGMMLFPKLGKKEEPYAERDKNGDIVIKAESLSKDKVAFIHIDKDSKIELLALLDEDGGIKIALGACQSCGGSPYAFYVQEKDRLICNNCGLSFPISELGTPGSGCHPITIPEKFIHETDEGIVLDAEEIMKYEDLFARVIEH